MVTGGAGYVGTILVPKLLKMGCRVRVLDLFLFGDKFADLVPSDAPIECITGDIRDRDLLKSCLPGCNTVIHLACISNDPSFAHDPGLSKAINYDAFPPLVDISKESGVSRFIYASTSSVYGVSDADDVTEDHPLVPLTDYNKYKGMCEPLLFERQSDDFVAVTIRPATVCGYSPRLRLDLTVNILTNHAVTNRKIRIFGGSQRRPNIHIEDITDLYCELLDMPPEKIQGQTFNAGYENFTIAEIGEQVRRVVLSEMPELAPIEMVTEPTDDIRSYHINSDKLKQILGWAPQRSIEDAVRDLCGAFREGKIPNSMDDIGYYNVKTVQAAALK
jgi:nucleoside-diphosphate-sugar epimerase